MSMYLSKMGGFAVHVIGSIILEPADVYLSNSTLEFDEESRSKSDAYREDNVTCEIIIFWCTLINFTQVFSMCANFYKKKKGKFRTVQPLLQSLIIWIYLTDMQSENTIYIPGQK